MCKLTKCEDGMQKCGGRLEPRALGPIGYWGKALYSDMRMRVT